MMRSGRACGQTAPVYRQKRAKNKLRNSALACFCVLGSSCSATHTVVPPLPYCTNHSTPPPPQTVARM
eukprot:3298093-Rhodomonas_salina.2